MGVLADRLEKAYKEKERRAVRIEEWDMTVYVSPLTMNQLARIKAEADNEKQLIRSIIVRARGEDGKPMFDEGDALALGMYGAPEVIVKVATEIMADVPRVEDTEKN